MISRFADARLPEARWDRILLGTVQLGLAYGGRRREVPLDDQVVHAILDRAWSLGVRGFDTAECYGNAASRLAEWLRAQGKLKDSFIVTKIFPPHVTDKIHVEAACQRFAGACSIMLLSHGPVDQRTFSKFRTLTTALGAEAGQSVYTASEVEAAGRNGVTRVQAPVNVFDSRQLETAHRCGVAIDGRSIYLQGVLLDEPAIAESRVTGAGVVARAVQSAAKAVGLSAAPALLAGVLAQMGAYDRAVIGADAPHQLEHIAAALEAPCHAVGAFLAMLADLRGQKLAVAHLLDPRTWPQPGT